MGTRCPVVRIKMSSLVLLHSCRGEVGKGCVCFRRIPRLTEISLSAENSSAKVLSYFWLNSGLALALHKFSVALLLSGVSVSHKIRGSLVFLAELHLR